MQDKEDTVVSPVLYLLEVLHALGVLCLQARILKSAFYSDFL